MSSISDVYAQEKELEYSSGKNEEIWRYARPLLAIYPSAMQNGILNEVNERELLRALLAQNHNGHGAQIWNHRERPTRELSYEGVA